MGSGFAVALRLQSGSGPLLHEVLPVEGAVHAQVVVQVEQREAGAAVRNLRLAARPHVSE